MSQRIAENTGTFRVDVTVAGGAVMIEVTHKPRDEYASLMGVPAMLLIESLDEMRDAWMSPDSPWHHVPWDECLAEVFDDALCAANPGRAAWKEGAIAAGWKRADEDPNRGEGEPARPVLLHEGQDRVWPLADWEGAARDLGYASPEEATAASEAPDGPASP